MLLEKEDEKLGLHTKGTFSTLDKIGSVCLLLASLFLINSSGTPIIEYLRGDIKVDIPVILPDIIFLIIGIFALIVSIRMIKKSIVFEQFLDMGFEEGIYARFEPILREIANAQSETKVINERLDNMNLNIDKLRKRSVELKLGNSNAFGIDISAQISRFLRLVLLINITLAVFIYLLTFTREFTPTLLTVMFIIWWLEITYDFNLWHRNSAYTWVFFPVLTIPVTAILSAIILGHDLLIGVMMLVLAAYSIAYYSWSRYVVEGMLPFDINIILSEFQRSDRKSADWIKWLAGKKGIMIDLFFKHRSRIHKASIILSVIFIYIAVYAFLVDNNFIPISWKQSLLPGFMAALGSQILTGLASMLLFILWRKTKTSNE
jgi:hypothetical protein